jgi:hypothetical protein
MNQVVSHRGPPGGGSVTSGKWLVFPVVVTALFHVALLALYAGAFHGDPGALVCLSRSRIGQAPFEAIHQGFAGDGYDGQFYYALARDPWRVHQELDSPALRHKRILYPALAWLLAAGNPDRLVYALPLVNVLAIAGLAGLGGFLSLRQGLSPWWGCLLPLAVNAGLAALRDLTDPLSTFLVCGLLVAWLVRARWWVAALWAVGAVFCREQNAVVVGLLLAVAGWQRRGWLALGLAGTLVLWAGWIGLLWTVYGTWPFHSAESHVLAWPFLGMVEGVHQLAGTASRPWLLAHLLGLLTLGLDLVVFAWLLRRNCDLVFRLLLLLAVLPVLLGGASLYVDLYSVQRVFVLLPLGAWLACVQLRRPRALLALSSPLLLLLLVVTSAWVKHGLG